MTTFKVIPNTTQSATVKVVNDVIASPQIKVVVGAMGPSGVAYATSPILYNSATQTISFDQAAQNITNDSRYIKRSGDTIDAGTIA